jgi:hypothetical protein
MEQTLLPESLSEEITDHGRQMVDYIYKKHHKFIIKHTTKTTLGHNF